MKKVIALLLSLTLLLSCAAVFAENAPEKEQLGTINVNGEFNLKCALPEGYRVIVADAQSAHLLATIMDWFDVDLFEDEDEDEYDFDCEGDED